MQVDFPAIPGWDVAGVVEAVGLDTPEYAVGDEVIAYARKDWVQHGTFAELVAAPVRTVARKPKSLDWHQAAALPLAGLTAYQLLTRLDTKEGDTVLIHAAAGGVGLLAVQIARRHRRPRHRHGVRAQPRVPARPRRRAGDLRRRPGRAGS